jgi:plasmid stability protein
MPTLYVENVPKDLYEALRKRARANRRSIAAEVITLLERDVPTEAEIQKRKQAIQSLAVLHATSPLTPGPFPSAEDPKR